MNQIIPVLMLISIVSDTKLKIYNNANNYALKIVLCCENTSTKCAILIKQKYITTSYLLSFLTDVAGEIVWMLLHKDCNTNLFGAEYFLVIGHFRSIKTDVLLNF